MQERDKGTLKYRMATLLPIAAGTGWGIVGLFIRILTDEGFDNITIIFSRNLSGLLLTVLYLLLFSREEFKMKKRDVPLMLMQTVVGSVLMMIVYNIAVVELSLSLAAVLLSTAPVFVLLISAVMFNERITLRKVLCMIGAFLGIAMLSGLFETAGMKWSMFGLIMGILSMVTNAIWILMSKVIANRGYSSFTVCFYSFLFTCIMLAPFADWNMLIGYCTSKPLEAFFVLIIQALITCLLPTAAYIVGMRYLDAGRVAILEGGAEPTSALLLGIIIYSEIPSVIGFAGMAITIIALGILAKSDQ